MLFTKREQIRRQSSDGFFWAIYYITIFESVYTLSSGKMTSKIYLSLPSIMLQITISFDLGHSSSC